MSKINVQKMKHDHRVKRHRKALNVHNLLFKSIIAKTILLETALLHINQINSGL